MSLISGITSFYQDSKNCSEFGVFLGEVRFHCNSTNYKSVSGAVFLGDSCNKCVAIDSTFSESSKNFCTVSGNAFFINDSVNYGSVQGTGFFLGAASNNGFVQNVVCNQIANFPASVISNLSTSEISNISTSQIRVLSTNQLQALTSNQVQSLSTNQIQVLSGSSISSFTTGQINALTEAQINSISSGQIINAIQYDLPSFEVVNFPTSQYESFSSLKINKNGFVNLFNDVLNDQSVSYLKLDAGEDF